MKEPPRVARALARALLPGRVRDLVLGDLDEAWRSWVARTRSPGAARLWYWRQAMASIATVGLTTLGGVVSAPGREGMVGELRNTLRAARLLVRRPGFAMAVVLTLGLGIGGTTAMWSVVDGVLLEPLDLPEPDGLVAIWTADGGQFQNSSGPNLIDIRSGVESFSGLYAFTEDRTVFEGVDGRRRQLGAGQVTHEALDVLGVTPALGRGLRAEDEVEGAAPVMLVSYALWTSEWGRDPGVVGRTVSVGGRATEVIGVLPEGLEIPMLADADLLRPFERPIDAVGRDLVWLGAIARVRADRSFEVADAEAAAVWEGLRALYPEEIGDRGLAVLPLRSYLVQDVRATLLTLLAATGLLLFIACVNAGGLLFIRGREREPELAVRAALGAGRSQLAAELLREGGVLLAAAALVGVGLAGVGQEMLLRLAPSELPRLERVALDARALAISLGGSLSIGVCVILLTSLGTVRHARTGPVISGARGEISSRGGRRVRSLGVATQATLAMVLLSGAALFARSLDALVSTDPGYRIDDVVMARVELPRSEFQDRAARADAFEQMETFAEAIPGVSAAGFSMLSPMRQGRINYEVAIDGQPAGAPDETPVADLQIVSPGYVEALEMPVVAGRAFSDVDASGEEPVAVVSEGLARELWPDESPLGRTIGFVASDSRMPSSWWRVVGVVGDVRFQSLEDRARGTLYVNLHQLAQYAGTLVVSVDGGDVGGVVEALRTGLTAGIPGLAEPELFTMRANVSRTVAPSRFQTTLILVFAAIAVTLAGLGMYGSVAYSVGLRRREIGLRLVLGAEPGRVVREVLLEGLTPALLGLLGGGLVAFAMGRAVKSLLYGVGPRDPVALVGAGLVLVLVAVVACLVPALRGSRVPPAESMREG